MDATQCRAGRCRRWSAGIWTSIPRPSLCCLASPPRSSRWRTGSCLAPRTGSGATSSCLRLARGAKVNHLALQRHVDAQIHETYVKAGLSLKRKVDIVFGELFFATLLSTAVMAMIGIAVAYGAKQALPLDDAAVGRVLTGFVAIGLLVGLTGGGSEARKSLDEARREMRKRQRMAVEWDPGGLGEIPAGPGD